MSLINLDITMPGEREPYLLHCRPGSTVPHVGVMSGAVVVEHRAVLGHRPRKAKSSAPRHRVGEASPGRQDRPKTMGAQSAQGQRARWRDARKAERVGLQHTIEVDRTNLAVVTAVLFGFAGGEDGGQVVVHGVRRAIRRVVWLHFARAAQPPQMGESVQQPPFRFDGHSGVVPVGCTQNTLEVIRRRVGRRSCQVEDRVVTGVLQVAERSLVEVHLA